MWPVFPWSMSDFKPGEEKWVVGRCSQQIGRVALLKPGRFFDLTRIAFQSVSGFSMRKRGTPGRV